LRYVAFLLVITLLVVGSLDADVERITPWLLGINFTLAIFSINFTFFGHQLSKYKAIYSNISKRQWLNIVVLMILPFVPLVCFLIVPEYFGRIALWIMPVLILSAIDNAILTAKYLSPNQFIKENITQNSVSSYLTLLSKDIKKEVSEHQNYLDNRDKIQIPTHAYDYEPTILGTESNDTWDVITVITISSVENNDYPVFRKSIGAVLELVIAFYSFKSESEDGYRIESGIRSIARNRLRTIINRIVDSDKNGIFLQSLSNELCELLANRDILEKPCSSLTRVIASGAVWVGQEMLKSDSVVDPLKVLNTLHRVVELNIYTYGTEDAKDSGNQLDEYNISMYAYDLKDLGVTAINSENFHFAYRCMESLSYLGCNAAKLKSTQTVVAVFESIVQLGRVARNKNIGCFWSRCLIPAESHAEEFIGHILTWLVQDIESSGNFYMKEYAEQAYSRLRGRISS